LNVEPAWRADCEVRLNWLCAFPGITAVIARMNPVPGSTDTIAAAGSSCWSSVWRIEPFASNWSFGSIVV
jgi:hypothetical protein